MKHGIATCLLIAVAGQVMASDLMRVGVANRTDLKLTVYTQNLAVISDTRKAPAGYNGKSGEIAFEEVSRALIPETCVFDGVVVREQDFNYDIADLKAMLRKSVGQTIYLERINSQTGERMREPVEVLNAEQNSLIYRYPDGSIKIGRYEQDFFREDEKPVFPKAIDGLWLKPTLTALAQGKMAPSLTLTCQSQSIGWAMDYVAVLNDDETRMDLTGLVTIVNETGVAYPNAELTLLAGDPRILMRRRYEQRQWQAAEVRISDPAADIEVPQEEALADYFLFTFPYRVNIDHKQEKQLTLLAARDIPVRKQYFFSGQLGEALPQYHNRRDQVHKALVQYSFRNTRESHLGRALPKGIVRFNKRDKAGRQQFIGASNVGNLADGQEVELYSGEAFGVTVEKQISNNGKNPETQRPMRKVVYKILNSTAEAGAMTLREKGIGSKWQLLNSSYPMKNGEFQLKLPPGKVTELVYTVEDTDYVR